LAKRPAFFSDTLAWKTAFVRDVAKIVVKRNDVPELAEIRRLAESLNTGNARIFQRALQDGLLSEPAPGSDK
jgi:hypothetical protein